MIVESDEGGVRKRLGEQQGGAAGWEATDDVSGIASTDATLDGAPITSGTEVTLFELSLGEHTLVVTATDKTGNETVHTVMFSVHTSIEDLDSLVDRFENDERLKHGTAKSLSAQLSHAEKAAAEGDMPRAIRAMRTFGNLVDAHVRDDDGVRTVLSRDAEALIEEMRTER